MVTIEGLNSGSYYLTQDKLSFQYRKLSIETINFKSYTFEIDKQSALEIMHTLLDSVGLLNRNTEELIELVEDRIEHL